MNDSPVAIVTGAGRGIGRAVAEALSQKGYRLALVARTESQLQETRAAVGPALVLAADVTRPVDVEQIIRLTTEQFGRIDAVVNAAGFAAVGPVAEQNLDDWQLTLETNLSSGFYLAKAVWGHFVSRGRGVLVNISSPAAHDPLPGLGTYGAAKAGVEALGLALAREGAAHGIRVHTISPSATETAMLRQVVSVDQLPTALTMTPADVAAVVAACVTGELQYTSGRVISLQKTP